MKKWSVVFQPEDSLQERLKKAAHVCPSPAQLKWMEREYIAFLHFSPNTLTGRQWGDGTETTGDFCPDALDAAQWAKVCADAGMKMVVPTLKHHDGFCQWHTDSSDFSTENSPVKTDIAEELAKACAKEGIDMGVYLSPWDMHERGKGVWPASGYDDVYQKQLRELLGKYGPVGELWLDGACGDRPIWTEVETYRPEEWYDRMEEMQPDCVVRKYDPFMLAEPEMWEELKRGRGEFNWRGKEVRWVGNENGDARLNERSVQPVFTRVWGEEATFEDLGQEEYYARSVGAVWYPNEVNTHVLNQWFWNEGTSYARPLRELVDIFYNSIGNNGTLLMNVSPDAHGVIPEDQIRRLAQFRAFMEGTFAKNLAEDAKIEVSSCQADAENILKEGYSHWSPDAAEWDIDSSVAVFEIRLPDARRFDNICLRENITEGQRVAHWRASAWIDGQWHVIAERQTIGYKRIVRFPCVETDCVRVEILRSWDTPMISFAGLYMTFMPETQEDCEEAVREILPLAAVPDNLQPGVHCRVYKGGRQSAANIGMDGREPDENGIVETINADAVQAQKDFSACFDGYFHVDAKREIEICVGSEDGCILSLNDIRVIDHDEPHEYSEKTAKVLLHGGDYHLCVQYTSFRHEKKLCVRWTNGPEGLYCPETGAKQ